jgi:hypothetical protein
VKAPPDKAYAILVAVLGGINIAVGVSDVIYGQWLDSFDVFIFGLLFLFLPVIAKAWRRQGYLRARSEMWSSLNEARQRRLSFQQWIDAEIEREVSR